MQHNTFPENVRPLSISRRLVLARKKGLPLLSDIALWTVLILLVASPMLVKFYQDRQAEERRTLRLSFQNADQLSRGSQVRMMGVNVGYVTKTILNATQVDVIVSLNKGAPKIPSRSKITVISKGLVGEKSIEITPPSHDFNAMSMPTMAAYVEVENPIRLKSFLNLQLDVAKKLQKGAESFLQILPDEERIISYQHNVQKAYQFTEEAPPYLLQADTSIKELRRDVHKSVSDIYNTVGVFQRGSTTLKSMLEPDYTSSTLHTAFLHTRFLSQEGLQSIQNHPFQSWVDKMALHAAQTSRVTQSGARQLRDFQPTLSWPYQLPQELQQLSTTLFTVEKKLPSSNAITTRLKNSSTALKRLNQKVDRANQSF
jgi:hypothetical protein